MARYRVLYKSTTSKNVQSREVEASSSSEAKSKVKRGGNVNTKVRMQARKMK